MLYWLLIFPSLWLASYEDNILPIIDSKNKNIKKHYKHFFVPSEIVGHMIKTHSALGRSTEDIIRSFKKKIGKKPSVNK